MLDIKLIRENKKVVENGCKKRNSNVNIDKILELDNEYRDKLFSLERIAAEKNKASRQISKIEDEGKKKKIILEMKNIDKEGDKLSTEVKEQKEKLEELLLLIPNIPLEDVPAGKSEKDNVVLREVGEKPKFDFEPKNYLEIAKKLDLIDIERSAKISGARFSFLKRGLVLLEFALVDLVFKTLIKEGFVPIIPPVMLKKDVARGMGYFEQVDEKEAYYFKDDDLYLAGTSEQPIGAMHSGEIFNGGDLPRRYVGFSTCFRREAGSYGKDTKGIMRVHQFDKVEMFSFCKPEESKNEHQFLLGIEEKLMKKLDLPYRVVHLCAGDMGLPSASTYDIETWIPSENYYRETHSTSNCADFQARRLSIRYKKKDGKLDFVHTLNGTAFAIPRILIAIIENYQRKDCFIEIPEVLKPYVGLDFIGKN